MDKENLYYIIRRGTNERMSRNSKDALISELSVVDEILSSYGSKFEMITIAEYETKFCESRN